MTVLSTTSSQRFHGSGSTGPFTFSWRFLANSDIKVYRIAEPNEADPTSEARVLLIEGTDYTLSGAGGYTGGSLSLTSALAEGEDLLVKRRTPKLQVTDIRNQGNNFFPEVHEDAFDRLTMMLQDLETDALEPTLEAEAAASAAKGSETAASDSASAAANSAQQSASSAQASGNSAAASAASAQASANSADEAEVHAQAAIAGQANGAYGYTDKATMDADLTPPNNAVALVSNDPDTTKNGWWRKSGDSGTGSWVQSSYDRVLQVENRATVLESAWQNWLDESCIGLDFDAGERAVANAIKAVKVEGGTEGEVYRIITFCKDDPTYGDTIIVANEAGAQVANSGSGPQNKNANGVTKVQFGAGPVFILWIDYNELGTGLLVNSSGSALLINPFNALRIEEVESRATDLESRATDLESRATDLENLAPKLPNKAVNGNLSSAGSGTEWVKSGGSAPFIDAIVQADLNARGMDYGHRLDNADGLSYAYKREYLSADDAGKYYFLSTYVWAVNGVWKQSTGNFYETGPTPVAAENVVRDYVEISPAVRIYRETGRIPEGITPVEVRIGNGAVANGPYMTGFTLALADYPIDAGWVREDDWSETGKTQAEVEAATVALQSTDADHETRITTLELETEGVTPPNALRVSAAGSSITWGEGYLGEGSYMGELEKRIRTVLAKTLHAENMTLAGTNAAVAHKLFYQGEVVRLEGAGASAECTLYGDEISVVLGKERGNLGAALIELYVDDVLHDTFSTYNHLPSGSETKNFVGDGSTVLFDLSRAFTYNHAVTVGGAAQTGGLNTQGYGGSIPVGDDFMVIRKLAEVGGVKEVHHYLMFAAAPANGAAIACTHDYGESICHARTTLGQTGQGFGTSLESAYGEGNVSYDPANPSSLSSGLDFRASDERAVHTWKFDTQASRTVRLQIQGLDSRATGATPELYLNFATNRMHHVQNAGIGGWTAGALISDTGLRNTTEIARFQPDIVLLESGTNDDWSVHAWTAWVTRANITEQAVKDLGSSLHLQQITYNGVDDYTVQDSRLPITAIDAFSVTLDPAGATFTNVQAGDVVILGDYQGDNRRLAARILSGWDAGTYTATWKRPLSADELAHIDALSDLVGTTAQIRTIQGWADNVAGALDAVLDRIPRALTGIVDMGPPNYDMRRLTGYPEKAEILAAARDCEHVKAHDLIREWIYGRPQNVQLYLDAAQGIASTGASEYNLYTAAGAQLTDFSARNFSVKVDGVERLHDGCHVEGGAIYNWTGAGPLTLDNDERVDKPFKLVFTDNVPTAGAEIVVKYSSEEWSGDDCHPGTVGDRLFGEILFRTVKRMA
ncbi:MAG: hypothetical protein RQ754_02820 [Desulfuromonadales bacterium]|nr:hypothetical protein [Desulfuromonadales bacterium]